ncbi:CAZyme family GH3 [Penicillium hispanicum]|uniref:CAZyme family GH3 n=1 Tax=Penicillium hispanicum TaxID=1080232 RepID=UPI002541DB51|nr:CAZyme family GH3 [Penicillium hispanicum]KAJ5595411.1 CAZyme family GH3 [Penicillium hispanicum]
MARTTRTKLGAPKTRRSGYESLEHNATDDEDIITTNLGKETRTSQYENEASGGTSDRDAAQLSDRDDDSDDSLMEDGANVKLLPLERQDGTEKRRNQQLPSLATPSADHSSPRVSDVPDEQRDVGKRIERLLETEQTVLSKSFNLDLEDGNSFIFSDDDLDGDDYGHPAVKGQPNGNFLEGRAWRSGWRSIFSMKSWWHIFGLLVVGLLTMWLTARGLGLSGFGYGTAEYASVPWYPTPLGGTTVSWNESYTKAHNLVQQMNLLEKVNITTGTGWMMGLCVGNTGPADLIKFPSLCLQDGPLGLRYADNISAFPAGITTGATWNRDLMRERGFALGNEARLKGVNVVLGPSMGALGMMPAGGRNWESFGSDPVLQGVAAAETIRGIQRNGVMATAKHFVMNEQEHFRQPFEWGIPTALSSNIDDRALHEVFVWPFAESVRADVASVMCSYQMVNNSHACENSKLLNGILKDELGFQGFVQSDWLAQRSGVQSALSGLDMSMPGDGLHWADGDSLWGSHLTRAVLNTSVPAERLNDMVTRIVAAWYHFRQDTWERPPPEGNGGPNFSSWTRESIGGLHPGSSDDDTSQVVNRYVNAQGNGYHAHSIIARKVAAEGTVLLKNVNNTLPLSRTASKPNGKYRIGIYGEDAGPGQGPNHCADRGCNQGTLAEGWGSGAVDFPYLVNPWEVLKSAWPSDTADVRGFLTNNILAQDLVEQDLCLVFANADGGEGFIRHDGINGDRNDLFLQRNGSKLVEDVAQHCGGGQGKTVVIIHSIGPTILDPWIDLPGVHAVLYGNLPGQESGNALMDVLFGDVDASGRLPYTIGHALEDYGPGAQVLYESNDPVPQVNFEQGLYIDHRYFDKYNITPHFEFGFGLSYTTFDFSALRINPREPKSRLPAKRPPNEIDPPKYEIFPESPSGALFPPGFKILNKYVYPYLPSRDGTKPAPYPYPNGYEKSQRPSAAGGGPGGNPSLYKPMLELSVDLTNTGSRPGKEVVQIYVSFPDRVAEHRGLGMVRESIDFPVRVLRNFAKVMLQPGETTTVNMTLTRKDLSYWSVRAQNWVLPTEGSFRIWAGRSSRDLPLVAEF